MQASMIKAREKLAAKLVDKRLLKGNGLINGKWVPSVSGKEFHVLDPATGFRVHNVSAMGAEDAGRAVDAAAECFSSWKNKKMQDRARILKNWSKAIAENSQDIAGLMCLESGKPLAESKGEVDYAKSFIDVYAGMGADGMVLPAQSNNHMLLVTKEPVGVCSLITPWNFPAAMFTRKAAPALMAGCTVVIKPAEDTPLTTLALASLWEKAGGPPGVLNVVPTSKDLVKDVAGVLTTHESVRKVSFTGSTAVGKQLLKQAAGTVKRTSMELGGNAPFVLCDGADVASAVVGAMASKFRFGGQVCIAPNRFLVQEGIHDEFVLRMADEIKALVVGDGLESRTNLGPLINSGAKAKVKSMLSDALEKGAELVVGGNSEHEMGANFFPPALLTGCTPDMRMSEEEIFGPIVGVMKFSDDDEALAIANSTKFGLAGYVYTRDYSRALRFANGLKVGMVGVNDSFISSAVIPFGGVKESGMGREGSVLGMEEYLEVKHICLGGI